MGNLDIIQLPFFSILKICITVIDGATGLASIKATTQYIEVVFIFGDRRFGYLIVDDGHKITVGFVFVANTIFWRWNESEASKFLWILHLFLSLLPLSY